MKFCGKVSNEVEWSATRLPNWLEFMNIKERFDDKDVWLEPECLSMLEVNVSKQEGWEALNERLRTACLRLKDMVPGLYGGGSVDFYKSEQRAPPCTFPFGFVFKEQTNNMMSFQLLIGVRRGKEVEAMKAYKSLVGIADVLAVFTGASDSILLTTAQGYRLSHNTLHNARLLEAYPNIFLHLARPLKRLLTTPNVRSYAHYTFFLKKTLSTIVSFLRDVYVGVEDVMIKAKVFDVFDLFAEGRRTNPYILHWPLVRIRLDHRDEEHDCSLEIRVPDNPAYDVEESVLVMEAVNAFVLNSLPLLLQLSPYLERRGWRNGYSLVSVDGRVIPYVLSHLLINVENTLWLARFLLDNVKLPSHYKSVLRDRVHRFECDRRDSNPGLGLGRPTSYR